MNIEALCEKYLEKKDIFYVFLDLPEFWEVRADGLNGAIYNKDEKVAMIYFKAPIDLRFVDRVEWLNETKDVYKIDYYGDFGYAYCQACMENGQVVTKSYFSPQYEERILLNYSNGVVTVFDGGKISKLFSSEDEFMKHYNEIFK